MISPESLEWYLSVLGIEQGEPTLDRLFQLVRSQIMHVPFENISKLWLRRTGGATFIPSLEEHLHGIEKHSFGGTCYANNPYFMQLLRHLGYDVTLCGADMTRPDVHVVSIVRIEGREYLVDVGYGAPFYEPMARDLDHDHVIAFGCNRYVLHPQNAVGRSRLDHLRDGELIHGYLVKPEPREIGHFSDAIRHSYTDAATFMNAVVVEKFFPGRSVRFHNFVFTESTPDGASTRTLANRYELAAEIEHHCGIEAGIVLESITDIALESDICG